MVNTNIHPEKMPLRFIKELDSRWYIDLPSWKGERWELEMVQGADTLCDILAQGEEILDVTVALEKFEGAFALTRIRLTPDIGGALYKVTGNKISSFEIWLCHVTEHVFGNMPKKLWIK